jgi:hypothetical protein
MNCAWLSFPPKLQSLSKHIKISLTDISFQDADGSIWINKRGFPTDGASIPYILEWIWDPFDVRVLRSVYQHDVQYVLHDFDPSFKQLRVEVDCRFLRSMKCEGWPASGMWYGAVRMFGAYLWKIRCQDPDAYAWFQATQQGEEAIDEWVKKCIENPQKLQAVRYYAQLRNDQLRAFRHIYNDLRGFKTWLLYGD